MQYRYGQVEAALAKILVLRSAELETMRTRVRHLRKLGVPRLVGAGSGRHLEYNWRQALEMAIALQFVSVGQAPRYAAELAHSVMRQTRAQAVVEAPPQGDMFATVQPFAHRPKVWIAYGQQSLQELCRRLVTTVPAISVVNVSACARRLSEALSSTVA